MSVNYPANEKKKALLAYKEKILEELTYCDKRIADFHTNFKKRQLHEDSDSSDNEEFFPNSVDLGPNVSQLNSQQIKLRTCLQATQELTGLTVLQSEVNILVEDPKIEGERPVTEPGTWKEVTAECRIDLVPFTISFYMHISNRKFGPTTYRGLRVSLVKTQHEVELNNSVLHTIKRPSEAVEVIRSYATSYRSRRTTLSTLTNKYGSSLFMEPHVEGGFVFKCSNLLEILWRLENKWSPVAPFHHHLKFDLEYMDESYVKTISQVHKQLLDPSIQTDERTLLLSKIVTTCLEAKGPIESESDLESRQTDAEQIPDSEVMAPPKSLPKKTKKVTGKDITDKQVAQKRTIDDESDLNNAKKTKLSDVIDGNKKTKGTEVTKTVKDKVSIGNESNKKSKTNDAAKSVKSKNIDDPKPSKDDDITVSDSSKRITGNSAAPQSQDDGKEIAENINKNKEIRDVQKTVKSKKSVANSATKKTKDVKEVPKSVDDNVDDVNNKRNKEINAKDSVTSTKDNDMDSNKKQKVINAPKSAKDKEKNGNNKNIKDNNDLPKTAKGIENDKVIKGKTDPKNKASVDAPKNLNANKKSKNTDEGIKKKPDNITDINKKDKAANQINKKVKKSKIIEKNNVDSDNKGHNNPKTSNVNNENANINDKPKKSIANEDGTQINKSNEITYVVSKELQSADNAENRKRKTLQNDEYEEFCKDIMKENNKNATKIDIPPKKIDKKIKMAIANDKKFDMIQKKMSGNKEKPNNVQKNTVKNVANTNNLINTNVEQRDSVASSKSVDSQRQSKEATANTISNNTITINTEKNSNVIKNKDKIKNIRNNNNEKNIKSNPVLNKNDKTVKNINKKPTLTIKSVRNTIQKLPGQKNTLKSQNSPITRSSNGNTKLFTGSSEKESAVKSKIPQKRVSLNKENNAKKINILRISPRKLPSKFKSNSNNLNIMKHTNIPRLMKKTVPKTSQ